MVRVILETVATRGYQYALEAHSSIKNVVKHTIKPQIESAKKALSNSVSSVLKTVSNSSQHLHKNGLLKSLEDFGVWFMS